jgi:cell division protein FtsI/penicillin-binding protein 2
VPAPARPSPPTPADFLSPDGLTPADRLTSTDPDGFPPVDPFTRLAPTDLRRAAPPGFTNPDSLRRADPLRATNPNGLIVPPGLAGPVSPNGLVESGPAGPVAPARPTGPGPRRSGPGRHGSSSGAGRRPAPTSRQTKRARLAGLFILAVGVLVIGLATGFGAELSAEPTAQAFLLDWQLQHYGAAGALTTASPGTAAADLKNTFAQLDATQLFLTMNSITQHGGTAVASYTASVDLAEEGRVWTYHGQFGLSQAGGTWKVQWAPSVVYPGLGQGERLAVVTQFPDRAPVLDAEGRPLQVPSLVYVVGVKPSALTDPAATADRFAQATGLDAGQVLGQITAAPPNQFLKLASLDPANYSGLRSKLHDVPGLVTQRERARLFQAEATGLVGTVGNETDPVLRDEGAFYLPGTTVGLTGLEEKYQRQLLGTPTTEVVAVTSAGARVGVLARWPGVAGTPVQTTISSAVQRAALNALNGVSGSGEIVAVQAKTGDVLAVAQHHGSGSQASADALNARLVPGTAFTIVSAAALLAAGVNTGTLASCENSFTVDGQTFTSDGTGATEPFSAEFADACGTAFADLSERLNAVQFDQVVKGFGIGADWGSLPVPAFSGSVPSAGGANLAAETIGQGNVQMSPLAMAMVAAAVDSGSWHTPQFIAGSADPSGTALNVSYMSNLRSLMRGAVRSGAARAASLPGTPVYGQVGLVHTGSTWTSWFVGFRGNIAFTVIESGKTSQLSAATLASAFVSATAN